VIMAATTSSGAMTIATWLLNASILAVYVSTNLTRVASIALAATISGVKIVIGALRAAFLAMIGACALCRTSFVLTRATIFLFNATVSATTMVTKAMIGVLGFLKVGFAGLTSAVAFCKAAFTAVNIEMLIAKGIVLLLVAVFASVGASMLYMSGIGGKVFSFLKDSLGKLWKSFEGTFGAIKKALTNGDISGAAKVLWADLIYRFTWGQKVIYIIFDEIRSYVSKVWENLQTNLAETFGITWSEIMDWWNGFCDAFVEVFQGVMIWLKKAWSAVGEWLARQIAWITAKIAGLDANEAMRIASEDYQRRTATNQGPGYIGGIKKDFKDLGQSIRDRIKELENDEDLKKMRADLDKKIQDIQDKNYGEENTAQEDEFQRMLNELKNMSAGDLTGFSGDAVGGNAGGSFSAFEALGGLETSSVDKDQLEELKLFNALAEASNKKLDSIDRRLDAGFAQPNKTTVAG